ncbi:hypothetical protein Belba_0085 [Belliella baltica DSM 15883]|uniref:Uncharacterized protein n=1 Tax=Belliella baltica (strain DSM 15883 / CIP 108006 / LMG 21964 / BA134) TaxID=866536 RepID=I3Z0I8_BELBD|nr:hypothetical protein [Belliella baltica]AFL82756.1 hypothetical protein Belba_0085 [Belliella baltica DSM 15883]
MKRTLSEIEIQTIKDRLDRCLIAYVEIYDELLDHYVTALEQVEPEEFDQRKELLDEEFAWSVVREMEKQLLNSVSSELKNSQLESLKFWKMDFWRVFGIFTYTVLLIVVYKTISLDVMMAFAFLPVFGVITALLYHSGNYFSFNIDPNYHRPRNVILQAALGRYQLVLNFSNFFFMSSSIILNNNGLQNWAMLMMLIYSTILNLYSLSLYSSINLKTFKLIKS